MNGHNDGSDDDDNDDDDEQRILIKGSYVSGLIFGVLSMAYLVECTQ